MLFREILTDPGVDQEDLQLAKGHIASIKINNPTGSWIQVTGLDEFVPPYIQGWKRDFVPVRATISVRFTNSPSGAVSDPRGNQVLIVLYDEPQGGSDGISTGAQTELPKSTNLYKKLYGVGNPGDDVIFIAAGTIDDIIIPTGFELRFTLDPAEDPPKGIARASFHYDPGSGDVGMTSIEISPERPSWVYDVKPGTWEIPAGSEVHCTLSGQEGMGDPELDVVFFYYALQAGL